MKWYYKAYRTSRKETPRANHADTLKYRKKNQKSFKDLPVEE